MTANREMQEYYARRAAEYEQVYAKPERQDDLARLRRLLQADLAGHAVLEIACGTGYWTTAIAETAENILATDVNEEVLAVARAKSYPAGRARFAQADAVALAGIAGPFTAGFAGFWWSHIPRARLREQLQALHGVLSVGSLVVWVDNHYVEGSNNRIARQDGEGNTYQRRTLESGDTYEILKNFPTEQEMRATVAGMAEDVTVTHLTHFWRLRYRVARNTPLAR